MKHKLKSFKGWRKWMFRIRKFLPWFFHPAGLSPAWKRLSPASGSRRRLTWSCWRWLLCWRRGLPISMWGWAQPLFPLRTSGSPGSRSGPASWARCLCEREKKEKNYISYILYCFCLTFLLHVSVTCLRSLMWVCMHTDINFQHVIDVKKRIWIICNDTYILSECMC